MPDRAPFFHDVAEGPDNVESQWVTASDGVRLRIAIWPDGDKGTVLLFPGRTEYVEKYGRAAQDLNDRGYATIAIDWRGQGLADRLLDDRLMGHVGHFLDYQKDVAELVKAADRRGLPKPYYLIAHSMGGSIGLRALMRGLPVNAAVFTAPMWGILITPRMRPIAWVLSTTARYVWGRHLRTPGTSSETYCLESPFEDNMLTTDPKMFAYMRNQLVRHPELALAGPSLRWLFEALTESRRLQASSLPDIPTLTFLGSGERVVDTNPIHEIMARWPGGRLELVEGAEHEAMMERPAIRNRLFDQTAAHFASYP